MKKITLLFSLAISLNAIAQFSTARVQVIHNSPDAALATADVYVNGQIYINDAVFRTSTAFMNAVAGFPLTIKVAPGNSTSANDAVYTFNTTFTANETYVIVASGILSTTGYSPATPFSLKAFPQAKETADNPGIVNVLIFQGATDLPTADAVEPGVGLIVNNMVYGDFGGYLALPPQNYILNITTANNSSVLYSYQAPFATMSLAGQAITVLASGFHNPAVNSNGPAFGLWATMSNGGPLVPLIPVNAGTADNKIAKATVYPNPASSVITINVQEGYNQIKSTVYDLAGRNVAVGTGNTVDVSGLATGVYVLIAAIDGKSFQQKISVKK